MNNEIIKKLYKEKNDLLYKIFKLRNFIGTEKWEKIGSTQAYLLDIQLNTMKAYNDILSARIYFLEIENLESENDVND